MKNKYVDIVEKFLFYIPFLMFVFYTTVSTTDMTVSSGLIAAVINFFNALYMKGPFVFIFISIILAIYIIIKGNIKHCLIMGATFIGCLFCYKNLFFSNNSNQVAFLSSILLASSYMIAIFYTLALSIYFKDKKFKKVKKKIISAAKLVVIYVGIIYAIAILSNTNQYSYVFSKNGTSAWFVSANGLGHAFVFLLPLFVLLYIKDKNYNYLFYIIVLCILGLLIGTKACYYSLLGTLIITILYLIIDRIKMRKYHYLKLISLVIILIGIFLFNSNLYASKNIKTSIDLNTKQGKIDVVNFVISGRGNNIDVIKSYYIESDALTKTFGIGLYYPEFEFIYIELDLVDLLFSRGIYGFLLYILFFGSIAVTIFTKVFKNIKKCIDVDTLLMFLTIGYISVASIFVGHVMFNLMSLTVAIMVVFYYTQLLNHKIIEDDDSKHYKKKKKYKKSS